MDFKFKFKQFKKKYNFLINNYGIFKTLKLIIDNFKLTKKPSYKNKYDGVLVTLPINYPELPPLGLAYLKSALQKSNISCYCRDLSIEFYRDVKYRDEFFHSGQTPGKNFKFDDSLHSKMKKRLELWIDELLLLKPSFIGVSIQTKKSYFLLKHLYRYVKSKNKHIKIIVGGPSIGDNATNFIKNNMADYVVVGDGEHIIVDLAQKIIKGTKISRKIYVQKIPLDLKTNSFRDFPDFSDFDLNLYDSYTTLKQKTLPILMSKGCKNNCTFCDINHVTKGYRNRCAQKVFDEMKYQKQTMGAVRFFFCDPAINNDIFLLEELCDLIIANGEVFLWRGSFKFTSNFNTGLFKKMATAGCYYLNIGMESGSEKVRRLMGKGRHTNNLVEKYIKAINDVGIMVHLHIMFGFPGEGENEFLQTIYFLKRNKKYIDFTNIGSTCMILPHTYLYENRKGLGIKLLNKASSVDWVSKDSNYEIRLERYNRAKYIIGQLNIGLVRSK